MRNFEEYLNDEELDELEQEKFEEEIQRIKEMEENPAWNERYLNTLGMSMRDFL